MGRLVLPEYIVLKDTREKEGWDFKPHKPERRPPRCLGTESATLKTGDYSIKGAGENLICIERKRDYSELFVNYSKRSLFEEECERLSHFKYKYILIESALTRDHFSLSPPQFSKNVPGRALLSWLSQLSMTYSINIIPVNDCGAKYATMIFEEVIRREKELWTIQE